MNEKVLTWFTAPVKRKQVHFDVAGVANNDNEPNLAGLDSDNQANILAKSRSQIRLISYAPMACSTAALCEKVKLYGNLIHMFFAMKSLRRLHLSILQFLGTRPFSSGWIGMGIPKCA